jgi:hypothetical protein
MVGIMFYRFRAEANVIEVPDIRGLQRELAHRIETSHGAGVDCAVL